MQRDDTSEIKSFNQVSTVFHSEVILRPDRERPITETDLENYVAEAAWKAYDRYRSDVAKRLQASELELVLKSVMVVSVKLDGHRVLNASGFRAKMVEIKVLVAIAKKNFVCSGIDCFEEGTLNAYIISETEKEDSLIYAEIGRESTDVYARLPKKTSYVGTFAWGEKEVVRSISELFMSEEDTGRIIFERFLKGEVSEVVNGKIKKIFYGEIRNFIGSLSDLTLKMSGLKRDNLSRIFVKSNFLPIGISERAFLLKSKRIKITDVGLGSEIDTFLEEKARLYGNLNQVVERRMKWIAT